MRRALLAATLIAGCASAAPADVAAKAACPITLFVLGVAQDAGKPQIANPDDSAWAEPSLRRLATALAVIDDRGAERRRYLFEATPDIKQQLQRLDEEFPVDRRVGLDGIFLTHAHIGHYVGLMHIGYEAANADDTPTYVMPRMAAYLRANGPWSQLVAYDNIEIKLQKDGEPQRIADGLTATPFRVPHREEFSEVVGWRIDGPEKSVLFLPDIDSWEDWDAQGVALENMLFDVDAAYLDATFFADGELGHRDMSGIPHPRIADTMTRLADEPAATRAKVRFIHLNHTNPALDPDSAEARAVIAAGFKLAQEGETLCL